MKNFLIHFPKERERGQAILIAIIFFIFISTTIMVGVVNPVLHQMNQSRDLHYAKQGLFLSESLNEDLVYRLKNSLQVPTTAALVINNQSATATVIAITNGKEIVTTGNVFNDIRRMKTNVLFGEGTAFHYGIQADKGGFDLSNSSSIKGNAFSNGPVTGTDNYIYGGVVSAGPTGTVQGIHATGTVYAHTISNSIIENDAYYQVISGSTVGGTSYPGSVDQATSSLPIPDSQIFEWENAAAAGGLHVSPCPYSISGAVTLGPKKINCNLNITGTAVVTLQGPLWVNGNISISNSADIKVDPSLGSQSVAIIADSADDLIGGKVAISNTTEFFGSGHSNSFIMLVSMNNSAENGGSTPAISITNSAKGKVLLYAPHGLINISNYVQIKEVTAYKIDINNSAQVIYESGLANLLFSEGPSGGYTISVWKEVP